MSSLDEFLIASILRFTTSFVILVITIFFDEVLRSISKIFTMLVIIIFCYMLSFFVYPFTGNTVEFVELGSTIQTFSIFVPIIFSLYFKNKNYDNKLSENKKNIDRLMENNLRLMNITENQNDEIMQLNDTVKNKTSLILELTHNYDINNIKARKFENLNNLFEQIILEMAPQNIEVCFTTVVKHYNTCYGKLKNSYDSDKKYEYQFILLQLTLILELIVLFTKTETDTEINKLFNIGILDKDLRSDLLSVWDSMRNVERKIESTSFAINS